MRVYGRVPVPFPLNGIESSDHLQPSYQWTVVETDSAGFNDNCYITALVQTFRLNWNESPFWGNYGIAAEQSVITQIQPDFFITNIQRFYSQFFPSLIIAKQPQIPTSASLAAGTNLLPYTTPVYNVSILKNNGSKHLMQIGI